MYARRNLLKSRHGNTNGNRCRTVPTKADNNSEKNYLCAENCSDRIARQKGRIQEYECSITLDPLFNHAVLFYL